ncbi:uncharacterized protein LOC111246765 isoform X2 [Varroa destructor]|uniref:Uncharacterized protein n=1 Tax=Varroa destructor TaxID=109461 RepID=A0A7M7JUH2_VARDE|nr:uncharacterized protein LOC111246765 isoform X2 [Varroa destructor]
MHLYAQVSSFAQIYPMFLRELPDELNPGRIPLKPLGRAARFITPCDACGDFSPKRLVSLCGHIFCYGCCVTRETPEGLQLRCVICNEKSMGDRGELTEAFLKSLRLACICGHEGSLVEIKEHLWNDEGVNHKFRDDLHTDQAGSKSSHEQVKEQYSPKEPDMVLDKPKAYFCVELRTKIEEHKRTGTIQTAPGVMWMAAGYPVRFVCQIGAFSGRIFLGVFIQMLNDQPSFNTWPMKKRIIIELYNLKGETVKTHRIATFANGKPVNEEFTIACNPNVGYGKPKFYSIDDLLSKEIDILCKGTACFSVEFQELPE